MNSTSLASVQWRRSNRSSGQGGECVEIAGLSPAIALRDSKNPDGPILSIEPAAFGLLVRNIRAGDHDL